MVNSQGDGPYTVRTLLGWVIYGPLREEDGITEENDCPATVNCISIVKLVELLVKQYNQDFSERTSKETEEMSREDVKFLDITNHSAKMKDGHYCLDLPFTQEDPGMPNNRCIAQQRIQSLKHKFMKNDTFHGEYTSFLTEMINSGYAEVVRSSQKDSSKLKENVEKEMQVFKTTLHGQCLCLEDPIQAEKAVICFSQRQRFKEEFAVLEAGKTHVKRSSHLYKLDPVLDEGLLRVGGRLNRLAIPEEVKHPIILSKDKHIDTVAMTYPQTTWTWRKKPYAFSPL